MLSKYVAVRLAKHTGQAMHDNSHLCKKYKPQPKQELSQDQYTDKKRPYEAR